MIKIEFIIVAETTIVERYTLLTSICCMITISWSDVSLCSNSSISPSMWVGCECLLKSNNDQVKPENTVKLRIRKNKNIPAKY